MDRKYFIQAVRDLYPNAVTIDTIEGAFDADGNQITLDDQRANAGKQAT